MTEVSDSIITATPPRILLKASGHPDACPNLADSQGLEQMIRQSYGTVLRMTLAALLMAGVSLSAVLVAGSTSVSATGNAEHAPAGQASRSVKDQNRRKVTKGSSADSSRKRSLRVSMRKRRTQLGRSPIKTGMANMQSAECKGAKVCNVIQRIVFVVPGKPKKYRKNSAAHAALVERWTRRLRKLRKPPHRPAGARSATAQPAAWPQITAPPPAADPQPMASAPDPAELSEPRPVEAAAMPPHLSG